MRSLFLSVIFNGLYRGIWIIQEKMIRLNSLYGIVVNEVWTVQSRLGGW